MSVGKSRYTTTIDAKYKGRIEELLEWYEELGFKTNVKNLIESLIDRRLTDKFEHEQKAKRGLGKQESS